MVAKEEQCKEVLVPECNIVEAMECSTSEEEVCDVVEEQECKTVGQRQCNEVLEQECSDVTDRVCNTIQVLQSSFSVFIDLRHFIQVCSTKGKRKVFDKSRPDRII